MACGSTKIETQYIGDIPIDNLVTLPDYILAERDVVNPEDGNTKRTPVRVPSAKLFPNGNLDNVTALEMNNMSITVPEGQVRAGYIVNEPGANIMKYADATHKAMFIMLGSYTEGTMLIQSTGFINILEGHHYIVGAQYYTGENGEPVTDAASGQKLFIPLSNTKLMINM